MPSIIRHGHFLLTKVVTKTASENRLIETVNFNVTTSVNHRIFRGSERIWRCLERVNRLNMKLKHLKIDQQ